MFNEYEIIYITIFYKLLLILVLHGFGFCSDSGSISHSGFRSGCVLTGRPLYLALVLVLVQ